MSDTDDARQRNEHSNTRYRGKLLGRLMSNLGAGANGGRKTGKSHGASSATSGYTTEDDPVVLVSGISGLSGLDRNSAAMIQDLHDNGVHSQFRRSSTARVGGKNARLLLALLCPCWMCCPRKIRKKLLGVRKSRRSNNSTMSGLSFASDVVAQAMASMGSTEPRSQIEYYDGRNSSYNNIMPNGMQIIRNNRSSRHHQNAKLRRRKRAAGESSYLWYMLPKDRLKSLMKSDRKQNLDTLADRGLRAICIQIVFAMVFGLFIGVLAVTLKLWEKLVIDFHQKRSDESDDENPKLVPVYWISVATIIGGLTIYLTRRFLPECCGGGLDTTKICMALRAPVKFRVMVYRMLVTPLYLGSGGSLGLEAPFMHAIAATVSFLLASAHGFFPSVFRLEDLSTWILVGTSSALGCIFFSPLAGAVFSVEILMNYNIKIGASFTLVAISSITSGIMATTTANGYTDLELDHASQTRMANDRSWQRSLLYHDTPRGVMLGLGFLIGVISALVGSLFQKLVSKGKGIVRNSRLKNVMGFPASAFIGILGSINYTMNKGCGGVWLPGRYAFQKMFTKPFCQEHDYYTNVLKILRNTGEKEWGIYSLGDITNIVENGGNNETKCLKPSYYVTFFLCKFFVVVAGVIVGAPGGTLFPSLILGASFGGIMATLGAEFLPDLVPTHEWRLLIMMSTAGFYSAIMKTPITAIFISLAAMGFESHGLYVGIVTPLIMASFIANLFSKYINPLDLDEEGLLAQGFDVQAIWKYGTKYVLQQQENEAGGAGTTRGSGCGGPPGSGGSRYGAESSRERDKEVKVSRSSSIRLGSGRSMKLGGKSGGSRKGLGGKSGGKSRDLGEVRSELRSEVDKQKFTGPLEAQIENEIKAMEEKVKEQGNHGHSQQKAERKKQKKLKKFSEQKKPKDSKDSFEGESSKERSTYNTYEDDTTRGDTTQTMQTITTSSDDASVASKRWSAEAAQTMKEGTQKRLKKEDAKTFKEGTDLVAQTSAERGLVGSLKDTTESSRHVPIEGVTTASSSAYENAERLKLEKEIDHDKPQKIRRTRVQALVLRQARDAVKLQERSDVLQMHRLCRESNVRMLHVHLLKTRCDVNAVTSKKQIEGKFKAAFDTKTESALSYCARHGFFQALHLLLYYKADVDGNTTNAKHELINVSLNGPHATAGHGNQLAITNGDANGNHHSVKFTAANASSGPPRHSLLRGSRLFADHQNFSEQTITQEAIDIATEERIEAGDLSTSNRTKPRDFLNRTTLSDPPGESSNSMRISAGNSSSFENRSGESRSSIPFNRSPKSSSLSGIFGRTQSESGIQSRIFGTTDGQNNGQNGNQLGTNRFSSQQSLSRMVTNRFSGSSFLLPHGVSGDGKDPSASSTSHESKQDSTATSPLLLACKCGFNLKSGKKKSSDSFSVRRLDHSGFSHDSHHNKPRQSLLYEFREKVETYVTDYVNARKVSKEAAEARPENKDEPLLDPAGGGDSKLDSSQDPDARKRDVNDISLELSQNEHSDPSQDSARYFEAFEAVYEHYLSKENGSKDEAGIPFDESVIGYQSGSPTNTSAKTRETVHENYAKCVERLLAYGCDYLVVDPITRQTALHLAAASGNIEICRMLLEVNYQRNQNIGKNMNVGAACNNSWNPNGISRLNLLECFDKNGFTPEETAICYSEFACAQLICSYRKRWELLERIEVEREDERIKVKPPVKDADDSKSNFSSSSEKVTVNQVEDFLYKDLFHFHADNGTRMVGRTCVPPSHVLHSSIHTIAKIKAMRTLHDFSINLTREKILDYSKILSAKPESVEEDAKTDKAAADGAPGASNTTDNKDTITNSDSPMNVMKMQSTTGSMSVSRMRGIGNNKGMKTMNNNGIGIFAKSVNFAETGKRLSIDKSGSIQQFNGNEEQELSDLDHQQGCLTVNANWGEAALDERLRPESEHALKKQMIKTLGESSFLASWTPSKLRRLFIQEVLGLCELRLQNGTTLFRHCQIAKLNLIHKAGKHEKVLAKMGRRSISSDNGSNMNDRFDNDNGTSPVTSRNSSKSEAKDPFLDSRGARRSTVIENRKEEKKMEEGNDIMTDDFLMDGAGAEGEHTKENHDQIFMIGRGLSSNLLELSGVQNKERDTSSKAVPGWKGVPGSKDGSQPTPDQANERTTLNKKTGSKRLPFLGVNTMSKDVDVNQNMNQNPPFSSQEGLTPRHIEVVMQTDTVPTLDSYFVRLFNLVDVPLDLVAKVFLNEKKEGDAINMNNTVESSTNREKNVPSDIETRSNKGSNAGFNNNSSNNSSTNSNSTTLASMMIGSSDILTSVDGDVLIYTQEEEEVDEGDSASNEFRGINTIYHLHSWTIQCRNAELYMKNKYENKSTATAGAADTKISRKDSTRKVNSETRRKSLLGIQKDDAMFQAGTVPSNTTDPSGIVTSPTSSPSGTLTSPSGILIQTFEPRSLGPSIDGEQAETSTVSGAVIESGAIEIQISRDTKNNQVGPVSKNETVGNSTTVGSPQDGVGTQNGVGSQGGVPPGFGARNSQLQKGKEGYKDAVNATKAAKASALAFEQENKNVDIEILNRRLGLPLGEPTLVGGEVFKWIGCTKIARNGVWHAI